MLRGTAKGFRIAIGLFGRRNVGKSSLLNALTRQKVSIVSPVAGTTTDPVEKPMELQPLGPVLFLDTAGIDDVGALGLERIERTQQILARVEIAVLIAEAGMWGEYEEKLLAQIRARAIPTLIVLNKIDLQPPSDAQRRLLTQEDLQYIEVSAATGAGLDALRAMLAKLAPERAANPAVILRDLVGPNELAVLVTPIDREAPKGRIKQLQVQTIRDLLDGEAACVVVKETGLAHVLDNLKTPPKIVVTDAQVFDAVARITPEDIPLTAFSILFARLKGDLVAQTRATLTIDALHPGDQVLIAEACAHHPIEDDIGRVKIPHWLEEHADGPLQFTTVQGRDLPKDLSCFKLAIHCGACLWTPHEMRERIRHCHSHGLPITNYGLAIAHLHNILERALAPFPEALAAYCEERERLQAAARQPQEALVEP
jgi:[FeFe] hydrogenase H-cluster maturation GTPase HydF